MATRITAHPARAPHLDRGVWVKLGLIAAAASIVVVLIVEALALALWPDIARFDPLNSYVRAAIFTLAPALVATALFAWLAERRPQPVRTFVTLSVVVLLLSFIPDYLLPVAGKTLLASTVAAALHVVAAIATVGVLVVGYRRRAGQTA
jgi:hypothetical protein